MTFVEIVNAVLADAFAESKRSDAQNWVRLRHAWLWDAEPWTFKLATGTLTFPTGQAIATGVPTNLASILAVYDTDGNPVRGIADPRRFFDLYNSSLNFPSSRPEAYTMVAGTVLFGPPGDGSSGTIVYEKTAPTLVEDPDPTGLPDGYDLALVHGGKAEGFKLTNIPLAANFDQDFLAAVDALRASYLANVRETGEQFGAYRPGLDPSWGW